MKLSMYLFANKINIFHDPEIVIAHQDNSWPVRTQWTDE